MTAYSRCHLEPGCWAAPGFWSAQRADCSFMRPPGSWPSSKRSARGGARPQSVGLEPGCSRSCLFMCRSGKWWGGICLGPRLLAIPCWIAILIATPVLLSSRRVLARLAAVALGLTLLSGILTARTYNPLRWEVPVNPNSNPVRFFDVEGYPPFALGRQPVPGVLTDAPARPQLFCSPRTLGP